MLPFTMAGGTNLEGEIRPLNKGQEEGRGRGGGEEGSGQRTQLSVLSSGYLMYSVVIDNNVYLKLPRVNQVFSSKRKRRYLSEVYAN